MQGQTIDVQVQAVMEYRSLSIPAEGSPPEDFGRLAAELTELSRQGYAVQLSQARWIILGKIVGFTRIAADMGRIVLPVLAGSNRGH